MDPLILSIDTCTVGSLALSRGATLLGATTGEGDVSHSNTLLREIDGLLAAAELKLVDVDLFAVAVGPGSFTGLRIGIATVKALAATLIKPTVGVSTLEAIAIASGKSAGTVALLPAGRGELFTQLFSVADDRVVTALDAPAHLTPARVLERYDGFSDLVWAGPGALAQQDLIEGRSSWKLAAPADNLAIYCAELALQRYRVGRVEQALELRALYVRPSDPELKKKE
jgi:tRNA threonylcarbamoyladenosine biosynthesis protein TsaB